jgi:hypothetical protein
MESNPAGSHPAIGGPTTEVSHPPAPTWQLHAPARVPVSRFVDRRPRAVLVNDRGPSWPRERDREAAVSCLRAPREYAADLQNSLDHRRVGEWRNAVERQDSGEHASLVVQPLTNGLGTYRARVYARGRATAPNRFVDDPTDEYLIQIWSDGSGN